MYLLTNSLQQSTKTTLPPNKRKRRNSLPMEDYINPLVPDKVARFQSFHDNVDPRAKTRPETMLEVDAKVRKPSFIRMALESIKSNVKPPSERPSLAAADPHYITPILALGTLPMKNKLVHRVKSSVDGVAPTKSIGAKSRRHLPPAPGVTKEKLDLLTSISQKKKVVPTVGPAQGAFRQLPSIPERIKPTPVTGPIQDPAQPSAPSATDEKWKNTWRTKEKPSDDNDEDDDTASDKSAVQSRSSSPVGRQPAQSIPGQFPVEDPANECQPHAQQQDASKKKEIDDYGFRYEDMSDDGFESDDDPSKAKEDSILDEEATTDDITVLRPHTGFKLLQPAEKLPCTTATIADAILSKSRAEELRAWEESELCYYQLGNRVERMTYTELEKFYAERKALRKEGKHDEASKLPKPNIHESCIKLRKWLEKSKDDRVQCGECPLFVEHELEWAQWLIDSAKSGVLHLRVKGCKCLPEWHEGGYPDSDDSDDDW